ncbi:hypothetical protein GBV73_10575 [Thermococcus sp. 101 C5]|jgi:hypothetical protein|uniref:hypothetical protein n=1 Tax=Thermococcus TaxID=2263 RepID=UPI00128CDEF7|nr:MULTISPECIES: hypothetical protein [Thermococcus]MCA6213719.1 hypothetical protein [Thermococcus bergensis]MPW40089.1 hypothetical protein [Thermococcus sp. 101 C5]HIH73162.1 DUF2459 domain-containing protein [Thermococcaceae archaeon]
MKTAYMYFSLPFLVIGIGVLNILVPFKELNYLTLFALVTLILLRTVLPNRLENRIITFAWHFGIIFTIGSLIFPYNKHLAYSYFAGAGVAATFYAFGDKLFYYAPQITYAWIGLAAGFLLSLTVFRDEVQRNNGLFFILTLGLSFTTLLIGKLLNYKPFSDRVPAIIEKIREE